MKPPIDQSVNIRARCAVAGYRSFQRGLSLIELMISITLGLIILASLSTLFINQSKTRVELDKSNRMIDNGRYALEVLSGDLKLSGYLGEYVPAPGACSYAPVGIGGYNVGIADSISPSPYADIPAASLRKGSDILVIRRASTETATAQGAAVAGVRYLQVSHCQYDAQNYLVGSPPVEPVGVAPGDFFVLRKKTCKNPDIGAVPYADLRRLLEHVYFISPDNTPGDGIPTLKLLETSQATGLPVITPLVEGIEYMQVEYGIDNNSSFSLKATTAAGSLLLTDLSADPVTEKIKLGMGVFSDPKIPAGYTVNSLVAASPPLLNAGGHLLPIFPATVTDGTITTLKAAGSGPVMAGTNVVLTIPYLTATLTSGSNILTNLSADPTLALVRGGYEVCASGVAAGSTIADVTPTNITLTKNAISNGVLVPLNIPAIAISPKPVAGDGVADIYTATPTDAEWPNVVSVKITLLARNTEPTKGYTDTKTYDLGNGQTVGPFNAAPYNAAPYPTAYPKLENYKRHVYTQFVRLVNTSGRRETP